MATIEEIAAWKERVRISGEELTDAEIAIITLTVRELNILRDALDRLVPVLNQLRAFHGLGAITDEFPQRTRDQVQNAVRTAMEDLTVD